MPMLTPRPTPRPRTLLSKNSLSLSSPSPLPGPGEEEVPAGSPEHYGHLLAINSCSSSPPLLKSPARKPSSPSSPSSMTILLRLLHNARLRGAGTRSPRSNGESSSQGRTTGCADASPPRSPSWPGGARAGSTCATDKEA
ncbi:hypothetical protein BD310DRAFT_106884 [Dichomitus squalens]|uniref:Uncharacterized protein n=1 Tax=Dichomitus squalens TaxID=114155 RepID=A0A4Q9PJ01_9APHY|nr:hypothetical protein BD310DRAFT_106884 [Dichomitus squalens]